MVTATATGGKKGKKKKKQQQQDEDDIAAELDQLRLDPNIPAQDKPQVLDVSNSFVV